MKKSLIRLGMGFALLVAFASCQNLGELKPEYFTVNPNPLEVKAGKVEGTITATFPEKYFAEKGVVEVTPVLVYEGGEATSESATYQGTKVEGNNETIQYKAGGTVSQNFSFNYVPAMKQSNLVLRFKATVNDKEVQIPEIQIAVGCIATATLADAAEIAPAVAKANFMRDTAEVTEADIMFQIQQATVKNNKDVKALNAAAAATAKDTMRTIQGLEVISAASPDGGVELNEKLANQRQTNTVKFLKKQKNNQAAIDAKYIAQDWEGFQKLVNESSIQDKELILSVLSQYQDAAEREAQIKNLSAAYTELAKDILPKLRRSHLALTVIKAGKTDAQILEMAKANPDTLNVEELMYAATIAETAEDAASFTEANAAQNPSDWRTNNNLAAVKFEAGNFADTKTSLDAAANNGGAEQAETNFNYALLAMLENNTADAEAFLGKAAGVEQLAEAQALLSIQNGEYAKAIEQFGNTVSNNAALAQLLSGNLDKAASILANVTDKNADTYYLTAICAARQNNLEDACAALKSVAGICKKKAADAATDLEFAKFWLLDEFKAAIQ
ncbi:MAG: hypothetical protein II215_06930 [Paludibacteraceae bacterium]|jgi:hypothetical protein|nr:hypothetical protein [Paludibacteraceae bacterium]MED9995345.1 hypothetical protein [Paludibacteraceae bacterium]